MPVGVAAHCRILVRKPLPNYCGQPVVPGADLIRIELNCSSQISFGVAESTEFCKGAGTLDQDFITSRRTRQSWIDLQGLVQVPQHRFPDLRLPGSPRQVFMPKGIFASCGSELFWISL